MSKSEDQPIGKVPFVDGVERDVYQDADGRQYVIDDDGVSVHGVWLLQEDEPVVVEHGAEQVDS